jgi:tRNA nucleotidyltransferase (CCA-adding enzyme)
MRVLPGGSCKGLGGASVRQHRRYSFLSYFMFSVKPEVEQDSALSNPRAQPERSLECVAEEIARVIATIGPAERQDCAPRAYIVGGWCRDRILKKDSPDVDMEVFGVSRHDLTGALRKLGYHVIEPKTTGTTPWKVIVGSQGAIDVTIPLRLIKGEGGSSNLESDPLCSLDDASRRRDFTCNAIYFDPIRQEFLDPHGGVRDISDGILRLVPDAEINPGIPLRACRMAAQFGYELDSESAERIRDSVSAGILTGASRHLLTKEILKLLTESPSPSKGLVVADDLGILERIFPAISALKEVPQSPKHHPEGSVFNHTMMVVDEAAKLASAHDREGKTLLMLAALFHDVGKLTTTQISRKDGQDRISAHGHEEAGVQLAKTALGMLGVSRSARNDVLRLVSNHMKPLELHALPAGRKVGDAWDNKVRMLVRSVGRENFGVFMDLARADQLGRGGERVSRNLMAIIEPIVEAVQKNDFLSPAQDRLLTGRELLEMGLSDTDGRYELILRSVEERRNGGRLKTRDQAKNMVIRHFSVTERDLSQHGVTNPAQKQAFFRMFSTEIQNGGITTRDGALDCLRRFGENAPVPAENALEEGSVRAPQVSDGLLRGTKEEVLEIAARLRVLLDTEFDRIREVAHTFVGIPSDGQHIEVRIVSSAEASHIFRRELTRYYGSEPSASNPTMDVTGFGGFYSAADSTIFLVPENLWPYGEDQARGTVFHEMVHAIQHQRYPAYESTYLRGLLKMRADIPEFTGADGMVEEITKSIEARRHWQECHARYFESLYVDETLWDDPSQTIQGVRWAVGLGILFDRAHVKESLDQKHVRSLVEQLFSEPWLVDAVFRDDGIVCARVPDKDRREFEGRVRKFCEDFTTRDSVTFVYL